MGRKAIFIHEDIFGLLLQVKTHFENITGAKFSWSTFLFLITSSCLAVANLAKLPLECPICHERLNLSYTREGLQIQCPNCGANYGMNL